MGAGWTQEISAAVSALKEIESVLENCEKTSGHSKVLERDEFAPARTGRKFKKVE